MNSQQQRGEQQLYEFLVCVCFLPHRPAARFWVRTWNERGAENIVLNDGLTEDELRTYSTINCVGPALPVSGNESSFGRLSGNPLLESSAAGGSYTVAAGAAS